MAKRGFTLVELLVVIAVIGVLTAGAIALINPVAQFQKANDARRKSDLVQIQKGLELYFQDNGRYPPIFAPNDYRIKGLDENVVNWGDPWLPYMGTLPKDPSSPTKDYAYNVSLDGQTYYLYASLDRGTNDPQACSGGTCASITSAACGDICSYGISSQDVSASEPIPPTGGPISPPISSPIPTSIPTATPVPTSILTPTPTLVPIPGLVAWWTMDGNANDSSGNGNNGTVTGATLTTDRNEQPNKAYNFNGVGAYINIPASASLSFGSSNFTIEAWVKTGNGNFILMDNGNSVVGVSAGSTASSWFRDSGGAQVLSVVGTTPLLSNWNHIVVVRDGTTAKLYVNGVSDNSATNALFGSISSFDHWHLGVSGVTGEDNHVSFFSGILDEVRIYNRALSSGEIVSLFSEAPIPTPTPILTYTITTTVFRDVNGNAIQDAGEAGYLGANVSISNPPGTSETTDVNGHYTWTVLAGSYTVALSVPGGYFATTATSFTPSVGPNAAVNFGIKLNPTPTLTPIPTPNPSAKRVFVTVPTYTGNISGFANADVICQARANTSGLGGTWKAWISNDTTNAKDRILDQAYKRLDGALIANSIADLTDGAITNPINIADDNTVVNNQFVWTATFPDGTTDAGANCSSWTSDSTSVFSRYGNTSSTDTGWGSYNWNYCNNSLRFYCFEQSSLSPTPTPKPSQTPVKTNYATSSFAGPVGWNNLTYGYRFKANVNGKITALWDYSAGGTKPLRLWSDTGTLLNSVTVTGNNTWVQGILATPTSVTAGTYYRMTTYMITPGGYYASLTSSLPATYGDIVIDAIYNAIGDSFPTFQDYGYLEGIPDINFIPD